MLDQFLLTIAYFEHAEKPVAFRIGRQTGIRESVRQTAIPIDSHARFGQRRLGHQHAQRNPVACPAAHDRIRGRIEKLVVRKHVQLTRPEIFHINDLIHHFTCKVTERYEYRFFPGFKCGFKPLSRDCHPLNPSLIWPIPSLPALFKQKKRTKRSTDRLKRLGGGRDTLTHYIYPSFVPPNFIYANL